jgi:hypothetical protein
MREVEALVKRKVYFPLEFSYGKPYTVQDGNATIHAARMGSSYGEEAGRVPDSRAAPGDRLQSWPNPLAETQEKEERLLNRQPGSGILTTAARTGGSTPTG